MKKIRLKKQSGDICLGEINEAVKPQEPIKQKEETEYIDLPEISTGKFSLNEAQIVNISECPNLFEGIDLSQCTPTEIINSKKLYNYIVESSEIARQEGKPLADVMDEGIFGALLGATVGATVGQSIMKAICKVLGIDEKGTLGSLLTSKVVLAAMGGQLGYRW